jgi:cytochrome P450
MTTTNQPISAADFARLLDPAVRADPYPLYGQLRAAGPMRLAPMPITVLSSYHECVAMLRDPRSSVDRTLVDLPVRQGMFAQHIPANAPSSLNQSSFLILDPPDHTRLRRLVSKAFTARVVQRLEPRITALVDDVFDRAAAAGSLDVVADLAYPLPVTVICELLGVPVEDEPRFQQWSNLLARGLDPVLAFTGSVRTDLGELLNAQAELHRYFEQLVLARRAVPEEDLLSALIAAEEAGDKLTHDELIVTCVLLLIAGHETTVNLIANGTLALLRHPAVLEALRADPELGSGVVEETLRYDPPVQLMARVAREDMEIGGTQITAGQLTIMLLAAAHRDPAAFTDPDRFDPRREVRHLAFGMGSHFCLGAPLARLEGRLALSRFAQRVCDPRLTTDPPSYKTNVTLRGPASLPVQFEEIAPRSTPW